MAIQFSLCLEDSEATALLAELIHAFPPSDGNADTGVSLVSQILVPQLQRASSLLLESHSPSISLPGLRKPSATPSYRGSSPSGNDDIDYPDNESTQHDTQTKTSDKHCNGHAADETADSDCDTPSGSGHRKKRQRLNPGDEPDDLGGGRNGGGRRANADPYCPRKGKPLHSAKKGEGRLLNLGGRPLYEGGIGGNDGPQPAAEADSHILPDPNCNGLLGGPAPDLSVPTRRPAKTPHIYLTDGKAPRATPGARILLTALGAMQMEECQATAIGLLDQFLRSDVASVLNPLSPSSFDPLLGSIAQPPQGPDISRLNTLWKGCQKYATSQKQMSLEQMLATLKMTIELDIWRLQSVGKDKDGHPTRKYKSLKLAARSIKDAKESQLKALHANGMKLVFLCASGTMYILFAIAALGKKTTIFETLERDIFSVACVLRDPGDDDMGNLVRDCIMPVMARMRARHFCALAFSQNLTVWCHPYLHPVSFAEVGATDRAFELVKTDQLPLPPRSVDWEGVLSATAERELPTQQLSSVLPLRVITSPLVLSATDSCPVPSNRAEAHEWTEARRERIETERHVALDVDDFEHFIVKQHSQDKLEQPFVELPPGKPQDVFVKSVDTTPFLLRRSRARERLQSIAINATTGLRVLFEDDFRPDDSRREGYTFGCTHGHPWNRYTEQGHGAPENANIHTTHRDGKKANHGQRVPYPSTERIKFRQEESVWLKYLQPYFDDVELAMKEIFPDETIELEAIFNSLPMGERPPCKPYTGVVINVRVCTQGHRDAKDHLKLCVVIPLGDFTGGQLVLYEAGIVVDIQPGDYVIFPSGRITHFNLHFYGIRASVVLHSDSSLETWHKHRNFWRVVPISTEVDESDSEDDAIQDLDMVTTPDS